MISVFTIFCGFISSTCISFYLMRRLLWKKTLYCNCSSVNVGHAVITGGNSGIGLATAINLARKKWHLTLGCRNLDSAQKIQKEIKSMTNNPNINVLPLDLQDRDSIRSFVQSLPLDEPIDILINNAAIFAREFKNVPAFGHFNSTFTTNFLGPFYLISLLIPHLELAAKNSCRLPRVIVVSSSLSSRGKFNTPEELFNLSRTEDGWKADSAYANSKLACNLFARGLHQKYGMGDKKIMNVFCTYTGGMVNTNLNRDYINQYSSLIKYPIRILLKLLLKSPDEGCQSILHCSLSNNVSLAHQNHSENLVFARNDSDLLFNNCIPINWPENSQHLELVKCLWSSTFAMLNLDVPD